MSNFSSNRTCRLKSSRYLKGRDSNSPTLSSSHSDKSLWARSYKNQPIPTELRRRLIGKKFQFDDNSDQDEQIVAVLEQEQQEQVQKNKPRLPKFKVISDWGQFSDSRRSRINSQRKCINQQQRCHSVASLRLPQVLEQKREDDELRKRGRTKLAQFRDNNEFGQNKRKRRSSSDYTQVVSHVQSMELPTQLSRVLPEQILQNQAEQSKSVKLPNQKSILTTEIQKIIVDEIDEKRRKKQQLDEQIESIIQQQKPQQEVDTQKLSHLLNKFQSESDYITKLNDQQDFSKKSQEQISQQQMTKGVPLQKKLQETYKSQIAQQNEEQAQQILQKQQQQQKQQKLQKSNDTV